MIHMSLYHGAKVVPSVPTSINAGVSGGALGACGLHATSSPLSWLWILLALFALVMLTLVLGRAVLTFRRQQD